MNFYLVPVVQITQTVAGQTQSIGVPKYSSQDAVESLYTVFTAIPYGMEGYALIALANANSSLSAESDVFSFPADLTQVLTDTDVSNIDTYFGNTNIPSDFAVTRMAWSDVLLQVAQIFLLAQALYGSTGQTIFAGTNVTLDSNIGSASQGAGNIKSGGTIQSAPALSALATAAGSTIGSYFDLSDVQDTDTVSDVLTSVSQQFDSPILIGQGAI
jgi:hypothetical protein